MDERFSGSKSSNPWHGGAIVRAGVSLLLAACGGAESPTAQADSPAAPPAPSGTAGAGTVSNMTPPSSMPSPIGTGGAGPGGSPEAIGGSTPISAAGTASEATGGTAPGAGGTAAQGGPSIALGRCENESRDTPCGVIVTPTGTEIALGPYGSIMDVNVGEGFENAIAAGDADGGLLCSLFSATFGEDPESTARLLDTQDLRFDLYTVFRPANVVPGERYPILTWGNGTCAQPGGYAPLLHAIASQGFFVVAPNGRWVGGASEMLQGIDFLIAANADSMSPYFGLIDASKVGAMGHSQGGLGTSNAAEDPRVQIAILFNGGSEASKPFLAISGDFDIGGSTDSSNFMSTVTGAPAAAAVWYRNVPQTGNFSGHLTLMIQPERVAEPAFHWFKYMLQGNLESREWFVGADCKLCNRDADFEYAENGLD